MVINIIIFVITLLTHCIRLNGHLAGGNTSLLRSSLAHTSEEKNIFIIHIFSGTDKKKNHTSEKDILIVDFFSRQTKRKITTFTKSKQF